VCYKPKPDTLYTYKPRRNHVDEFMEHNPARQRRNNHNHVYFDATAARATAYSSTTEKAMRYIAIMGVARAATRQAYMLQALRTMTLFSSALFMVLAAPLDST